MQGDGNRLVECQECHGLYHQECHQPPINEAEIPVNDPRLAWYCSDCKKKLNKAVCALRCMLYVQYNFLFPFKKKLILTFFFFRY